MNNIIEHMMHVYLAVCGPCCSYTQTQHTIGYPCRGQ